MTLLIAGDILLFIAAGLGVSFILTYWACAPWWRSAEGRNVQLFAAVLLSLLIYLFLAAGDRQVEPGIWNQWVRLGLFTAAATVFAVHIWRVLKYQRLGRKK